MENRQNCYVARRVEKFIGVPGRGQRTGFCFAVTDHAGHNQIRIIKNGAKRMAERIPELPTLVNRSRTLRRRMTRNASGKRKLTEKFTESFLILTDIWVDLAVGAFQ